MLAVSGIDSTIKIFSPDARARRDAAAGIGVKRPDTSSFSSLGLGWHPRNMASRPTAATNGNNRQEQQQQTAADSVTSEPAFLRDIDLGDFAVAPDGLESRRRMHEVYNITSMNDMTRRRGSAVPRVALTANMLAVLTRRIEDGEAISVEGNDCVVM